MKVLSIKQPWAYAIFHLGKDIENRTRHTKIRGEILVHTSKQVDITAYNLLVSQGHELPPVKDLPTGKIIGSVKIIDSVDSHPSVWKQDGAIGYVIENQKLLEKPIPHRGQLGFWNYDFDRC